MIEFKNVVKKSNENKTSNDSISFKLPNKGIVIFDVNKNEQKAQDIFDLLTGNAKNTTGDILYHGLSKNEYSKEQFDYLINVDISYIIKDIYINNKMTIFDNIRLTGQLRGKSRLLGGILKEHNEYFNLNEDFFKAPNSVSKINITSISFKVAIARALLKESKILIIDTYLDSIFPRDKVEIYSLLEEISKDMTVVIFTRSTDYTNIEVSSIYNIDDNGVSLRSGDLITEKDEKVVVSENYDLSNALLLSEFFGKMVILKNIVPLYVYVLVTYYLNHLLYIIYLKLNDVTASHVDFFEYLRFYMIQGIFLYIIAIVLAIYIYILADKKLADNKCVNDKSVMAMGFTNINRRKLMVTNSIAFSLFIFPFTYFFLWFLKYNLQITKYEELVRDYNLSYTFMDSALYTAIIISIIIILVLWIRNIRRYKNTVKNIFK